MHAGVLGPSTLCLHVLGAPGFRGIKHGLAPRVLQTDDVEALIWKYCGVISDNEVRVG